MTTNLSCAGCGYDLRALASDRCPECGRWFDRTGRLTPRLPGGRRGVVRIIGGDLRTAWRVSRRPGLLADELDRMVDPRDAARFRRAAIGFAGVSAAAALYAARAVWYVSGGGHGSLGGDLEGLLIWGWSYWVSVAGMLLFLVWATAVPGWWVYSRRLEHVRANRAAALARYTCAPLVWTPLTCAAAATVFSILDGARADAMFARWEWSLYVGGLPLLQFIAWAWCVVRLAQRTHGWGRLRTAAMTLPLLAVWAALAVLAFGLAHGVSTMAVLLHHAGW